MLTRDFQLADAEVGGDGRTLVLACVPFDAPAWVDDGDGPYREGFRRGAFRHVVRAPNRVELRYNHRQEPMPYGFGVDLIEDPTHLVGMFRVAPSDAGDQMLALVADDQLAGVSIGYLPGGQPADPDPDGVLWRTLVKQLAEVSLTPAPAYPGVGVLAVRDQPPAADLDESLARRAQARARWQVTRMRIR